MRFSLFAYFILLVPVALALPIENTSTTTSPLSGSTDLRQPRSATVIAKAVNNAADGSQPLEERSHHPGGSNGGDGGRFDHGQLCKYGCNDD